MSDKICCFAGHRDAHISESAFELFKTTVEKLIQEEEIFEFWVGDYGQFDRAATHCVLEMKKKYPNIKLILVVPYITEKINFYAESYNRTYDFILTADIPLNTPKRFMIERCNQYMVNNSHYLLCFIEHSWGGAAKTMLYAKRKKIKVINFAKTEP